jgi:hypothetical protein
VSLYSLIGKWGYKAGTSGTPTIPAGAQILRVVAHASAGGASFKMRDASGSYGNDVPVVNGAPPTNMAFRHLNFVSPSTTDPIVFTGTDQYLVEYIEPQTS